MFLESLSADVIVQVLSLFLATTTFIIARMIEKKRDREERKEELDNANREIYQRLEFASIDLFRFEAAHVDMIRPIWEANAELPEKGTAEYIIVLNYVCQILNLFEIAVKFRMERIMPPDIFGSWIAWFYLLISSPGDGFRLLWKDLKFDYIWELREIFVEGFAIYDRIDDPWEAEVQFYQFVGKKLECGIITGWINEETEDSCEPQYDRLIQLRNASQITATDKRTDLSGEVRIGWENDASNLARLVRLFIDNSSENYISHGEIYAERAISEREWTPDVEKVLEKEFAASLLNAPFVESNILSLSIDGEIIAFCLIEYVTNQHSQFAVLSDIIVDKSRRKMSLGTRMIDWLKEPLKSRGYNFLLAESNISNTRAHEFLTKQDFKSISKVFKMDL